MQRAKLICGSAALAVLLAACNLTTGSDEDFSLPQGDVDRGRDAFVSLQCTTCHQIKDLDLPPPRAEGPVRIVLGGGVTRLKSYNELVTSIINPSHKLARGFPVDTVSEGGESLMANYNDVMTVSQVIDLVAFLDSRYEKIERPGYRYPKYEYD